MQTLPEGDPEPFMDRLRIYTLRTAEALEHSQPRAGQPYPQPGRRLRRRKLPPSCSSPRLRPRVPQAAYLSTRSPSSEREGKQ